MNFGVVCLNCRYVFRATSSTPLKQRCSQRQCMKCRQFERLFATFGFVQVNIACLLWLSVVALLCMVCTCIKSTFCSIRLKVAGGRRVPGFVALVYTGWGSYIIVSLVCKCRCLPTGCIEAGYLFLSNVEIAGSTFFAHAGPAVGRAFVGTASCFLGIEALGRAFRLLW